MKKFLAVLMSVVMLMSVAFAVPFSAEAKTNVSEISVSGSMLYASKASINKKAHKKFKKKVKALAKKSLYGDSYNYQYADVTGDGIHELIIDYYTGKEGSGRHFKIYRYKNGKLKCILDGGEYGLYRLLYYKKSKMLVMKCGGHGGEVVEYYKYSGGKYERIASKGRQSAEYGGTDGPWHYHTFRMGEDGYQEYVDISRSEFKKLTKLKGKKKVIKVYMS